MRVILTFHSIDDGGTVLSYPVARFRSLVSSLRASEVPIVTLDELKHGRSGVSITFDDGMQSVLTAALPVLRDYRCPAHLFLTTGSVGRDNHWPSQPARAPTYRMLTWDDIDQCVKSGMLIESHTQSHPDLSELDDLQILEECEAADRVIERQTGRKPGFFAYPYGIFDRRVTAVIAGRYRAAATTRLGYVTDWEHPMKLPRIDTYYVKSPFFYRHLLARRTRFYLFGRHLLRLWKHAA